MDDLQLQSIWNAYDKKLEKSLQLNIKLFESLQTDKAKSKLNALLSVKIIGIVLGILWVLFLGVLVYGTGFKNLYFTVSAGAILVFSAVGIATYIKHISLINQIDYTGSITNTQQKLAALQVSTINITRFLWLQMPFYTTFFWSPEWAASSDFGFWFIAVPITLIFTLAALWLYKNISTENLHKAWMKKFMMMGVEYKYILVASNLLQEIADFKQGG